ncbi:MAG: YsnF/AvaK domain-containing protein [Ktedonobacteraceae bacterium]
MTMTDRSIAAGVFTDEAQAQQAMADLQNADFTDDQIRYSVHKGGSGILDSLTGLGFGQDEANYYNSEFMNGRTVVTVKSSDRFQEAADILQRDGGYDASRQVSQASSTAQTDLATDGEQKVHLKEEQLLATKERVQAGEVDLHKEVISEQKTINVPVSHEEVFIERQQVNQPIPTNTPISDQSEDIRVPVSAEQVNVEKQTMVYEEVGLGKRAVQENQQVSDTVRHEEARIEREGNVRIEGENLDDATTQRGL